jgi:RNA polymerase sigma-70 factor (ECF subfamily)
VRADRPEREERFRALYTAHHLDVLRFVARRADPDAAEDVVAEAFLVAWRRLDDAPRRPDDVRAWLFGVARHCLLNAGRGRARRESLAVRVAVVRSSGDDVLHEADDVAARLDLSAAWRRLTVAEQEVLALTVFEDLTSPQAGAVLGIPAAAYRLRLMRARRSLRRHLDAGERAGSPESAVPVRSRS